MQKRITRFSIVLLLALSLRLILEPNAKSLALYAQSTEHSQTKPTVVLVRPAHWSKSLAEWKTYRSSEYQFSEVDSVGDSELLRKQIAKAISEGATPTAAILLCGDATLEVAPKQWRALTPGIVLDTQIQLGELTTKELCTDALYGDLDQDGCPDVAVGRLPAKTPEELTRMLRRSMDYEAIRPGPWNDTVHSDTLPILRSKRSLVGS
jgi:hypothetical protein